MSHFTYNTGRICTGFSWIPRLGALLLIASVLGCSADDGSSTDDTDIDRTTNLCTDQVVRLIQIDDSESLAARFSGDKIVATWAEPKSSSEQASVMLARYDKAGEIDVSPRNVWDIDVSDWPWPGTYLYVTLGVSGTNTLVAAHTKYNNYSVSTNVQVHSIIQGQVFDDSLSGLSTQQTLSDTAWHNRVISAHHPMVFPKADGFHVAWYDYRLEEPVGYGQIYTVNGIYFSDVSADGSVSSFDTQISQEWAWGMSGRVRGLDSSPEQTTWISNSDGGRETVWTTNDWSQTALLDEGAGGDGLDYLDTLTAEGEQWMAMVEGEDKVQISSAQTGWAVTTVADTGAYVGAGTRLASTGDGVYIVWVETSPEGSVNRIGIAPVDDPSRKRLHTADLGDQFADIQDVQFVDGAIEFIATATSGSTSYIDLARICLTGVSD